MKQRTNVRTLIELSELRRMKDVRDTMQELVGRTGGTPRPRRPSLETRDRDVTVDGR